MNEETILDGDHDPAQLEVIPDRGRVLDMETFKRPVSTLMRTQVGTVTPGTTVKVAAAIMTRGHYGCVLVTEQGKLLGILSERDILTRVVDRGLPPETERLETHMTASPECIRPDDAIAYALNLMAIGGFRHVPITDKQGVLKGIVSIRDIARLITETFSEEILTLPPPKRRGPTTQHGG